MLLKFSVENFRSISKRCEINFLATKDEEHQNYIRESSDLRILPTIVTYGANGSGKTNMAKAINAAQYIIMTSSNLHDGDQIPYNPFKLKVEYHTKPTLFEFLFIQNDQRYRYGFSFTNERVVSEFLHTYPNGRQTIIFERELDSYNFKSDKKELEVLASRTNKNKLFLSSAAVWNYEKIIPAFRYFKDQILINSNFEKNYNWLEYTIQKVEKNIRFKKLLISILSDLGTGIVDIRGKVEKRSSPYNKDPRSMGFSELKLLRKGYDLEGNIVGMQFDLLEESKGTQKLIELIGPWIDIMSQGKLIVVDELDTSLHPMISQYLVKMFNNKESNPNGGQLFFTTHDTNLLDLDFFRRDQIYFTEKNSLGESDFYSLSDLKSIRKDENIRKGYIKGKYGAIPFLDSNVSEVKNG
ncbi:MAG: ATPase [Candidatus Cloacimonadota bacterium]|nr:MAG: ATPase [Candidatus Cloacimonadota bacterium]PIE81628.1 MAG: ATPase [Candidatus Delongbacteria bacterium]